MTKSNILKLLHSPIREDVEIGLEFLIRTKNKNVTAIWMFLAKHEIRRKFGFQSGAFNFVDHNISIRIYYYSNPDVDFIK